jgi:hypothetical protein
MRGRAAHNDATKPGPDHYRGIRDAALALARHYLGGGSLGRLRRPWQCLYFSPDPHGHRSLRPSFVRASTGRPDSLDTSSARRSRASSSFSQRLWRSIKRASRSSTASASRPLWATFASRLASSSSACSASTRELSRLESPKHADQLTVDQRDDGSTHRDAGGVAVDTERLVRPSSTRLSVAMRHLYAPWPTPFQISGEVAPPCRISRAGGCSITCVVGVDGGRALPPPPARSKAAIGSLDPVNHSAWLVYWGPSRE